MAGTVTGLCVRTLGEAFSRKWKRTRCVEKSVCSSICLSVRFSVCRSVTWNQRLKSLLDFYEIRCRNFLQKFVGHKCLL